MNFSEMDSGSIISPIQTARGKYQGVNLAFDKQGDFNKHLDQDEMIKYFEDVMGNRMIPPPKKPKMPQTQFLKVDNVDPNSPIRITDD